MVLFIHTTEKFVSSHTGSRNVFSYFILQIHNVPEPAPVTGERKPSDRAPDNRQPTFRSETLKPSFASFQPTK